MKTLLLATARQGIEAEFGPDAYAELTDRLQQLAGRLATRSIESHVAVVDDPLRMALAGLPPVSPGQSAVAVVRAFARRHDCDAVLLLGGHRVLPVPEIRNPVHDRGLDADPVVVTDLPYGADRDSTWDYATCPRIVSRLPSPRSGRPDDFLALLDAVARPAPAKSGATAIVSQEWLTAGAEVARRMPGPVLFRVAPHYRLDGAHRDDLTRRWLYVNLHGRANHDDWEAFDKVDRRYVTVIDPASFDCPEVAGSSMFCENCYGVKPLSTLPGGTCIDSAFGSGLRSVVGATGLAYGAHFTKRGSGSTFLLENADCLASAFFDGISKSLGAGEAFRRARGRFVARIRSRSGHRAVGRMLPTPFELKTLLQFQLFGDPTV